MKDKTSRTEVNYSNSDPSEKKSRNYAYKINSQHKWGWFKMVGKV